MEKKTEEPAQEEISLIDYIIVLAKRKVLIIVITLSIAVLTAIYSFIVPEMYMADVSILPPAESSSRSVIMGELSSLIGIGTGSGGLNNSDVIKSIIGSRSVSDMIIDRFGLMEIYEAKYRNDARMSLAGQVTVSSDRTTNIINISVSSEDPVLAVDIANAYVEVLSIRMQELAITNVARKRLFFEEQLKKTKEALIISEEAMREFQEKTGILMVEEQAGVVIEGIAAIRAQIAAKEVELKVMRTYFTPNNPDFQMVQETLKGLKVELKKLEQKEGNQPDTLMPLGRMPGVGTDYIRRVRDLRFNEKLFEIMAKQYEMARIDEAKDPAILQVIDKAVFPEKRYKPQRRKMVTIATMAAFFFSVFLVFFIEYISKTRSFSDEDREKINTLKKYIFNK